jgi:hypothetical protein
LNWLIFDPDTHVNLATISKPSPFTELGLQTGKVSFYVPRNLLPGDYTSRIEARADCGGNVFNMISPEYRFQIVKE